MITLEEEEEDRTNQEMQSFWRATNGTGKETTTNSTFNKLVVKGNWV